MKLIPWRPFDFSRFFEDDDWFLPVIPRISEPALDLYETEKEVVAKVNLPGVDPEKINVTVDEQTLRISGSTEEKSEEKKKGYFRREIRQGAFERVVQLPVPVKADATEANYDRGVLEIIMPKAEPEKTEGKKIKVKVKK